MKKLMNDMIQSLSDSDYERLVKKKQLAVAKPVLRQVYEIIGFCLYS